MSGLSDADRMWLAEMYQVGGFDVIPDAVEAIVARHVNAALTEAADQIEAEVEKSGHLMSPSARGRVLDAADIVRNLAQSPSARS